MKAILLFLLILVCASCSNPRYCNEPLDMFGFQYMGHGQLLSGNKMNLSVCMIRDPKDWDWNLYFTGNGLSDDFREAMMVLPEDTCELKNMFFEYMIKHRLTKEFLLGEGSNLIITKYNDE